MSVINPIPSGDDLKSQWEANEQTTAPVLPTSWTATVLLSPFGDLSSALTNASQLVVGTIEYSWAPAVSWMRARLYLTQDQTFFDFVFLSQDGTGGNCQWYWIDSTPQGLVNAIHGPLTSGLRIPAPTFFTDMQGSNQSPLVWGNRYPLMCTDTNPYGIDCDHWTEGRGWYAFRRDTGNLFRILQMQSSNPQLLPILGSFFIANIPTLNPNIVSSASRDLVEKIRQGAAQPVTSDVNQMVTQPQIHQAMAQPLASARCTPQDLQTVLPGFIPMPARVPLPAWTNGVYIEGWTLYTSIIPWRTRVCYLWTGKADSKQQSVMIGSGGNDIYMSRLDSCLDMEGLTQVPYAWNGRKWEEGAPGEKDSPGLLYPNWLERDNAEAMGQIAGNADFGLAAGETLNLFAAKMSDDGGVSKLSIFWVWFLGNGVGTLFSEGDFINSSNHLQIIDYYLFVRNAPVEQTDFSFPQPATGAAAKPRVDAVHGHPTHLPHRQRIPRGIHF